MPIRYPLALLPVLLLMACDSGGMTSDEIEQAAMDYARQELGIAADVPLEAEVWVAEGDRNDVIYCGTVSGAGGATQVRPQRFAATTERPIRWIVFEEAHNPLLDTGEDRVPDWVNLCEPQNHPNV